MSAAELRERLWLAEECGCGHRRSQHHKDRADCLDCDCARFNLAEPDDAAPTPEPGV